MKNKAILFICATLISVTSAISQGPPEEGNVKQKEASRAKKIAVLTDKLQLTPEESEEFWPVYKERNEKLKANRKNFKAKKPHEEIEKMSDSEVKELIQQGFVVKRKALDIQEAYNEKFMDILGPKRTGKLYHLEHEFKKHHQRPGGHQGPRLDKAPPPGGE